MSPASLRQVGAATIFTIFCIYLFSSGTVKNDIWRFASSLRHTPDFSRYTPPRVLSEDEFPLHDPHRRVVLVGDVHGMEKPFRALLDKLSYDPSSDVLLHVGDIIAKGPHEGSMAVLSYMAQNNVTGVRGNHDQKVIEWRSWLEWIRGIDGGKRFLTDFHAKAKAASPDDPEEWAEKHIKKITKRKWRNRIPDGWKILSDHYRIARAMSDAEYRYLLSLPLVLHVPTAHTFIAHAGVLPSDPRYAPYHRRQPLARIPDLPHGVKHDKASPEKTLPLLRRLQETAVLTDVPQNTDPWVTLNMRGVLADHSVTRSKDGKPWSDVWNHDIDLCEGFDQHMHLTKHSKTALPCYPATVVYGHAAGRGLDVKRWSIGLDSGCVYNNRLSSLVIESKFQKSLQELKDEIEVGDIEARKKLTIPFGDGKARIIDITCK
ncbi:calcineurin-like phosphoesterase [Mycena albidolilacea]|uniref:Calcineurin-like phosphoesterase n=1 Tax=Mycena albidolilacea TaxID=1033008 RepID=A0AAD7F3L0_9AGAR|nr:calcineurin-like phosphoesterase [Mycena albidolilacea]